MNQSEFVQYVQSHPFFAAAVGLAIVCVGIPVLARLLMAISRTFESTDLAWLLMGILAIYVVLTI